MLAAWIVALPAVADDPRCTSSPRDCERQIRQMLSGRRFLGVTIQEQKEGLMVKSVVTNSPAKRSGIRQGDRLVALNGKSLTQATPREFKQILAEARETGRIWVIVEREGAYKKIEARLEPYSREQVDKIVAAHLSQSHPATAKAH